MDMDYEMAVLAALVQLDRPTCPKITEETGISAQRVNIALKHLKDLLDIVIYWHGTNKTGYYQIESWGTFESRKSIKPKAYALNLQVYKTMEVFEYEPARFKKCYANEVKLHNYRHSLKLEGFTISTSQSSTHSPQERAERRTALKEKYTKLQQSADR
ncbi:YhfG family protein [Microbulbifer sp. JMSA003]|uniref:YhfG family protein n=1 Tax=Microbulbifer sp. JMSA003 TaxID=3243369 RepID=UPI00403937F3